MTLEEQVSNLEVEVEGLEEELEYAQDELQTLTRKAFDEGFRLCWEAVSRGDVPDELRAWNTSDTRRALGGE